MASHDSYSNASDEPVYEIDSFEMLWEQHKGKVIAGVVVVLVAIGGVFGWLLVSNSNSKAAIEAFAAAKTPEQWREVIAKYPKSPSAGNAALLLAQSLRDEKKIDEANKVLEAFASSQPDNQFAPLASLAIAENEALAGKLEEAKKSLQLIGETGSKSFVAPFALMMKAELHVALWERTDALRAYEMLYRDFDDTVSGDSSEQAYQALVAQARPTAAPTPEAHAVAPADSAGMPEAK